MKYLDPRADLTFKRVFGEHPDLVMSLLNALLPLAPGEEITDIEYLPSELIPENPLRKYSIVDVRCKDKLGRQFLVEMQMIWSPEFKQRVLFNASKAYARQLKSGEEYKLVQPVYSLNLVNEVFEPELEGYYHHYAMVHLEHSDKIIEGLQLIFVELPKFNPHTFSEKKMQVLWLRYLTEINSSTEVIPEDLLANPEVSKAVTELKESSFSDAQLLGYEKFWDMINVEKMIYRAAENKGLAAGEAKGLAKGLAEGKAEGKAEGLAEGKAEGLAEGLAEGEVKGKAEAQRLIAANFKKQGVNAETIAQCTGMSIEEINKL